MKIITFGTFDLFHIGHLNILKRAKQLGDYLIVGVSSDELNKIKGKESIISLEDRIEIIKSICYVDEVFIEEKLELKDDYIKKYNADVLVMGDDWKDKFNWVSCEVIYFERTPNISTTQLKNFLK
jgi:glycerol-3-phosphate cytidylyltransferase